jgi:hypothetical protein
MRLAGLLLGLWAVAAQAAPDNGFGLYLGALSSRDSSLYGNSNGGFVQADAQFMVNSRWSLDPYLLLGSESTDRSFDVVHGEGGLQARYWMTDNWFLGGEVFEQDSLLKQGGTVGTSTYGPGVGLAAGWESDSRWSVMLATKYMSLPGTSYSALSYRSEALLLIGYRFH